MVGWVVFLATWVLATLALSHLPWFRRRRPSIGARLGPYVDFGDPVRAIEAWLSEQADS